VQGHHVAHQAGEVLAAGLYRPFHHRALEFLAPHSGVEVLDLLLGGLLVGCQRRLQNAKALSERRDGILGARQRRFLGGEGAGERAAALQQGGAGLVDLLNFGFAIDAFGFEIGHARLQGIALHRDVAGTPVVIEHLLGAAEQMRAMHDQRPVNKLASCAPRRSTQGPKRLTNPAAAMHNPTGRD